MQVTFYRTQSNIFISEEYTDNKKYGRTINMDLRKTCLKALSVFTVAFVLPMGIWCYSKNAYTLKNIAFVSAGITMGKKIPTLKTNVSSEAEPVIDVLKGKEISKRCVLDINMAQQELEVPSKSNEIPSPKPSEEVLDAIPYPQNMENHDGIIENFTYGYYTGEQYFDLEKGGQVRNCTSLDNDMLYLESKKELPFKLDKNTDEPQVLIYHTHATESFEPYERDYYDSSFTAKTTDRNKNIISVGDKICEQLDKAGIAYVHDTLVHDYPSYDGSYDSSRATVSSILKKYPSIKICLDIHRDGIEREDGTRLAPVVEINGKKAAQIMIISCCDDGTMNMPNYLKNFSFASNLQSLLESDWKGLTRPILFDYRSYNQDLTTGSLLIEVGSHGNSIEQVRYSGELIGSSLVKLFK